jgi:arsenate reductase
MRKIYHLANCGTCQRIIEELGGLDDFEKQNIKERNISADELDELKRRAGSYEALFSRNAMKYRSWGLKDKNLTEKDLRHYILEEYTFLKRPVIIIDDEVFVGNAPSAVSAAKKKLRLQ